MKQIVWKGMQVCIQQKRMKNMYLRVKEGGMVYVTAPVTMTEEQMIHFLQEKEEWILAQQGRMREKEECNQIILEEGELVPLWGKLYQLRLSEKGARTRIWIEEDQLHMQMPIGATMEMREKALLYFYRQELKREVPIAFAQWEPVVGKKHATYAIKDMKSRWGSCNVKTAQISINLQLVKKPRYCLDYVVVHELSHLWVANHGPEFKACMDQFYPNWREIKTVLNDYEA